MALKIRLARGGSKKRPFYRIVVAEATSPRDGRFVERVGSYNPLLASDHADRIVLNTERVKYWMSVGAQPTDRVIKFFKGTDLATSKAATVKNNPKQAAPKKKAQERLKAEQEKTATLAKVEKEKEIDVEEEVNAEVETPGQEEAAMEGETRIEAEAEIEEEEEESEEAEAQEEIEAEEKLEIETEAEEEIKEEEEA